MGPEKDPLDAAFDEDVETSFIGHLLLLFAEGGEENCEQ